MSWVKTLVRWLKGSKNMAKKSEENNVVKPKFVSVGITGDSKKPAETPWGAAFRTTLSQRVQAASGAASPGRTRVKFGYSCDFPVLAWANANVAGHGLKATDKFVVFNPGEELYLDLENDTTRDVEILEATTLLNVHPLIGVGFEIA